MTTILVVADERWTRNEVHAGLTAPGLELVDHSDPASAAAKAVEIQAVLVIVDLQVGSMGGMAVTRDVRHLTTDTSGPGIPVVMLLDRSADEFLAKRAGAAAWVAKPFTSTELVEAVEPLLAASRDPSEG